MQGTIVENLSGRKLSVLVALLLLAQVACFLIGGLIAPTPSSAYNVLGTNCVDTGNNTPRWFYTRGHGACRNLELSDYKDQDSKLEMANKVVFVFQIPVPRENVVLDYSRWQQNLIGVLQFDVAYHAENEMDSRTIITIDAKLGYRNKGDPDDAWKPYASALEERSLDCVIDNRKTDYYYNCSIVPLFELGSLHHDFYLLNIRLPVDHFKHMNEKLGQLENMWLITINQNGGFTKVWVSLKTVFFPFIVGIMIWFWKRVHQLARPPALLEYMLIFLGGALTLLNAPLEYLTLYFDMPFMLLLGDIKQGIFYSALLSFWLVFAGEHMMVQEDNRHNHLRVYWKHLSAVGVGCLSLFIFDMCERGIQLRNPFYSIWVTDIGTNLALTFIILAGISAGVYFLFLSYMIWKVFQNISAKRSVLPGMSSVRRLHYEGVIYRFKFLMLATLLCAAMTVVGFILGQVAEGRWKWDESLEIEYTSAFFTGVYGMWNIYIFALLCLYAPSHKKWPVESESHSNSVSEEIEFSRLPTEPSEISSLASFARKAALD
ncbi:hypothetical protein ONE63_004788 [Megalurothrips usitatus]|uniref:Protein wntless n=1 Tax=Megalurothrips usitatus TaxID=439358 RepID=A0AAV7X515_9NEOP|nr:hypothetical protein ONE63_004788 [Megalurothrips usitatus]